MSEASKPPPIEFSAHRERLWQQLKKEHDEFIASQARAPIQITLRDGATVDGKAWETRPIDIARNIRCVSSYLDVEISFIHNLRVFFGPPF